MHCLNYLLPALALLASSCRAEPARDLFTGRDFVGWECVTTPTADIAAVCKILPEGVITATGQPGGYIATQTSFRNYRLHAEWRWPGKAGNSGVLLHISSGPKDRVWPLCFQVQTKNKSVGDLLPMAGATFAEPLAPDQKIPQRPHTAPDSEKPAGEWNSCDILCRDGSIEVTINGVLQNKITAASPAAGRIGFQLEGTPFELRHITLQPLD